MIYMDVDAALSEVPLNVMSLTDDTDFKTREESVTFNQSGLDLVWNFVTTAGAFTQTAVTPTNTAGDYDWVNQGNGDYTIEIPAAGGASVNNDTEGFGWFSGVATGILPWRGPTITFRDAALNNLLIDDAYSATRGLAGTALPAAAADATGGLVISDAGGLDIDAMNAAAVRMTAVRAAVLTDWINGGRLDLLLDAIPTTAMRGTDSAALASVATEARLAELDAANLPTDVAAIPTTAMRGTDSALTDKTDFSLSTAGILAIWHQALTAVVTAGSVGKLLKDEVTSVRMATLTDWINGGRLDLLLDAIPTTAMRGTDGANTTTPLTAAGIRTALGMASADLDTQLDKLDEITSARMAVLTDWINGGRLDLLLDAIPTTAMRGTDSAATAAALATAQLDLDKLTGEDGATLATTQGNYAPLKPTTADRTLDVTATGAAGIDWGNVENKTSTVALTSTTVGTVTANADLVTAATIATAVFTTQLTESYAADTTAPTLAQALFAIQQGLLETSIVDLTLTTKKINKSTTAMTHTLDDATTPTSRTRAT
jgi:hypothetical protein